MIQLELQIELHYEIGWPGADFVFNIHAAQTARQRVLQESLALNQPISSRLQTDPVSGNRCLLLRAAPGELQVSYAATLTLRHFRSPPELLQEVPVRLLRPEAMAYLLPSRYCQSDRLIALAGQEFGHLRPGYGRVQAVCDWVTRRVRFQSHSSDSHTSALDTLLDRRGVCRDFAHLMIALCRALCIPARFASGTDFGADPALGPPDFQAYVEVFLSGGWFLFDPSGTAIPMGFVRLATGRDAADAAFATMFGPVRSHAPWVRTTPLADASRQLDWPTLSSDALSTDTLTDSGPTPQA